MGGLGSGMITSLRNNKKLLPKRKRLYEKDKLKNVNYSISEGLNCDKDATEEQLLEIRTRIQKRNHYRNVIYALVTVLGLSVVFYFGFSFFKIQETTPSYETHKNKNAHLNYIKYGDTWLEDRKWRAAIQNYQKAVELAPNDYHSQYRLALGYAYHCAHENSNCEEGNQLLDELITTFGSNSDLEYLKGIIVNR